MWRRPDGTFTVTPPATVAFNNYRYKWGDLSSEQRDEIKYNEAVPIKREPFTTYTTEWQKDGLVYREIILTEEVNEVARFEATRALKQTEITNEADALLRGMAAEYGKMEMATWDQQYDEAVAFTADNTAAVPLLTAIATNRSMGVAELAARIVANRDAWVALSGAIVGQRLAYQDALEAATTTDEVQAINVNYATA